MAEVTLPEWLGIGGFALGIVNLALAFHRIRIKIEVRLYTSETDAKRVVVEVVNHFERTVTVEGIHLTDSSDRTETVHPAIYAPQAYIETGRSCFAAIGPEHLQKMGFSLPGSFQASADIKTKRKRRVYSGWEPLE